METSWPVAAGDAHTLSAEQLVALRQLFLTVLFGTAEASGKIDYLGSTYVEDTRDGFGSQARRHLLQGGSTGTLLVRMSTVVPSSQIQQISASLSRSFTSGALGTDMFARGLPRPMVLNMGEQTTGHDAPGRVGLATAVTSADGSPPAPKEASSAGIFVMTAVSCCVCLTVVLAVLVHVTSSQSSFDRERELAGQLVERAAKRHNWSHARVAMVSRLLESAVPSRRSRARSGAPSMKTVHEEAGDARTGSDQAPERTASQSETARTRSEAASPVERPEVALSHTPGSGESDKPFEIEVSHIAVGWTVDLPVDHSRCSVAGIGGWSRRSVAIGNFSALADDLRVRRHLARSRNSSSRRETSMVSSSQLGASLCSSPGSSRRWDALTAGGGCVSEAGAGRLQPAALLQLLPRLRTVSGDAGGSGGCMGAVPPLQGAHLSCRNEVPAKEAGHSAHGRPGSLECEGPSTSVSNAAVHGGSKMSRLLTMLQQQ
ncbi:hypothetical protein FOA52_009389 [Chlamydomonas sp. UWO 241]|nr:hypothetical protein FOA52_009389 [Chlamydomonas sp. UWO 241]